MKRLRVFGDTFDDESGEYVLHTDHLAAVEAAFIAGWEAREAGYSKSNGLADWLKARADGRTE